MKRKITIILTLSGLLFGGCASHQPSYYSNRSSEAENVVIASGKAAENAALVNVSTRGGGSFQVNQTLSQRQQQQNTNQYSVTDEVIRTTQRSFSSELNSAIRHAIQKVFNTGY